MFSLVCTAQVAAKQMVGVYLSIWVRQGLLPHVHGTQVTSVGTGVLGYLGNKGGHCSRPCRSACCTILCSATSGTRVLCRRCEAALPLEFSPAHPKLAPDSVLVLHKPSFLA